MKTLDPEVYEKLLGAESWEGVKKELGLLELYLIDYDPGSLTLYFYAEPADERVIDKVKELTDSDVKICFISSKTDAVNLLLDRRINPSITLHGGSARLSHVENEGVVVLDLMDACSGCPHSVYTLTLGIKNILQRSLPWVKDVKSATEPVEPDFGFKLADLIDEK